jgi:hypothetical protein
MEKSMKSKCLIALLILISFLNVLTAQNISGKGNLYINPDTWNFGIIRGKKTVRRDFVIENKGKKNVTVTSLIEGCGCVSASLDKDTILPGKKAYLKVAYESDGVPYEFSKTINIVTDESDETIYSVTVKGEIR